MRLSSALTGADTEKSDQRLPNWVSESGSGDPTYSLTSDKRIPQWKIDESFAKQRKRQKSKRIYRRLIVVVLLVGGITGYVYQYGIPEFINFRSVSADPNLTECQNFAIDLDTAKKNSYEEYISYTVSRKSFITAQKKVVTGADAVSVNKLYQKLLLAPLSVASKYEYEYKLALKKPQCWRVKVFEKMQSDFTMLELSNNFQKQLMKEMVQLLDINKAASTLSAPKLEKFKDVLLQYRKNGFIESSLPAK